MARRSRLMVWVFGSMGNRGGAEMCYLVLNDATKAQAMAKITAKPKLSDIAPINKTVKAKPQRSLAKLKYRNRMAARVTTKRIDSMVRTSLVAVG